MKTRVSVRMGIQGWGSCPGFHKGKHDKTLFRSNLFPKTFFQQCFLVYLEMYSLGMKNHLIEFPFVAGFRLLLVQCSRFLQHCVLRFALEYFEYTNKNTKIQRRSLKKALRFFSIFIRCSDALSD